MQQVCVDDDWGVDYTRYKHKLELVLVSR